MTNQPAVEAELFVINGRSVIYEHPGTLRNRQQNYLLINPGLGISPYFSLIDPGCLDESWLGQGYRQGGNSTSLGNANS